MYSLHDSWWREIFLFKYVENEIKIMSAVKSELVPIINVSPEENFKRFMEWVNELLRVN